MIGGLPSEAFTRAGGARLVAGNRVRLLKDATETILRGSVPSGLHESGFTLKPTLFTTIRSGARFADLLSAKAKDGVK
jgi:hypothetical protein